ncbi:MAG: aminopeptidase [Eubacteriales bacterium]|nr:aminopeptidase [Eubacteriales bacterium]
MHRIEKYAELLIKAGINIQKNQTLVISSPIETADFTRILTVKAYEAGAREVVVRWLDEKSTKIRYDMASDEIFDEVPEWMKTFFTDYSKANAAFLTISASDPELMKDVNPKRISRQNKAMNKALTFWRSRMMSNMNVWCVASIPTLAWAKKVFPYAENEEAIESLWNAILKSVRVDMDDPVEAWHQHQRDLNNRTDFLNNNNFKSLHFSNKLGTDLTIDLPDGHIWFGGGDKGPDGQVFFANMPTEEVFTVPHMLGVNGKVYSSMPLNYNGNLIENLWFEFKDGLVVDFGANNGVDTLRELLETDEGSKRLGEVALVPHDSPISNQGILFFNTLYDENASCHLALGKAYPTCLKDGASMDLDGLKKAGVNDSLVHVDFMIGTKDLDIVGVTQDGSHVQVFSKGNFVIGGTE